MNTFHPQMFIFLLFLVNPLLCLEIAHDNSPKLGLPIEASSDATHTNQGPITNILHNTPKKVIIRYFYPKEWASKDAVNEYVTRIFNSKSTESYEMPMWSQLFSNSIVGDVIYEDGSIGLFAAQKGLACIQDQSGKPWFIIIK